jgi:lipopolysaccharide export system protein LptA
VKATTGATTWETSIFPDSKRDTYLLPLKAKVRQKEGIAEGSRVTVTVKTIGFF